MSRKRGRNKCVVCGKNPAEGWAWIGDDRYCHGDDDREPTCYMRGQWAGVNDLYVDHALSIVKSPARDAGMKCRQTPQPPLQFGAGVSSLRAKPCLCDPDVDAVCDRTCA